MYVNKDNRVELKEDEYFIADLIGCDVFLDDNSNDKFGKITDVFETGANDVYEITLEDGGTVLVPAIKDCIIDVNVDDNKMVIHLLEGLME